MGANHLWVVCRGTAAVLCCLIPQSALCWNAVVAHQPCTAATNHSYASLAKPAGITLNAISPRAWRAPVGSIRRYWDRRPCRRARYVPRGVVAQGDKGNLARRDHTVMLKNCSLVKFAWMGSTSQRRDKLVATPVPQAHIYLLPLSLRSMKV